MPNDFVILAGFLERFGDEVEGRELQEPPPKIKRQIHDMARGQLPPDESAGLLVLLNQNPAWIARLAEEVKSLRSDAREQEP